MVAQALQLLRKAWPRLSRAGQTIHYHPQQIIFYEGHLPYGVFVIKHGAVECVAHGKPCALEHRVASPMGAMLGLRHLLTNTAHDCTCQAATETDVLFISKTLLLPLLQPKLPKKKKKR